MKRFWSVLLFLVPLALARPREWQTPNDRPGPGRGNGNSTQAEIAKSWPHTNDGSPFSFRPSLGVFVKMIL